MITLNWSKKRCHCTGVKKSYFGLTFHLATKKVFWWWVKSDFSVSLCPFFNRHADTQTQNGHRAWQKLIFHNFSRWKDKETKLNLISNYHLEEWTKGTWSCISQTWVSNGYISKSKSQLNFTKYSLVIIIRESTPKNLIYMKISEIN